MRILDAASRSSLKSGEEFYPPRTVVMLLIEMIEPLAGRVYDGCGHCGTQAERFVNPRRPAHRHHGLWPGHNDTTWHLTKMNLAIRGIEADLSPPLGRHVHDDLHPDRKADYGGKVSDGHSTTFESSRRSAAAAPSSAAP